MRLFLLVTLIIFGCGPGYYSMPLEEPAEDDPGQYDTSIDKCECPEY